MKRNLARFMAMCIVASSLSLFAQDKPASGDEMKHDAMHDSMKHDKTAKKHTKKTAKAKAKKGAKHDDMKKDAISK